jgi:hypothetical protein
MGESITQRQVWTECDRIGEARVRVNIAEGGVWTQPGFSRWYDHAHGWLQIEHFMREQGLEAAVRRANYAAWFSAAAAAVSAITAAIAVVWSITH